MIETTVAPGNDSALDTWLGVEPDVYLDARRPEWRVYDVAGLVRFIRRGGERCGRCCVAPAATEIIEALTSPAQREPEPRRSP
jgi:hypothetical protein